MSPTKHLDVFKFIDAVKKERFLYDKSDEEYRNADKRQQVWNEIALQFGFSDGKEAYKKWKYFKDHFFAEKKKMKDRGVDEVNIGDFKKWQYYDALKWTENFLDKRKSRCFTDEQMDDHSSTPTPTMVFEESNHLPTQVKLENCVNSLTTAFQQSHNLPSFLHHIPSNQLHLTDGKKHNSEKENEMESFLFRPLESAFAAATTAAGLNALGSSICHNLGQDTEVNNNACNVDAIDVKPPAPTATAMAKTNSKQQQQLLHQALVAESEEELFGRLVARDLVRLPANLRPLARLKIQELLYHFSTGHIPELH